MILCSDAEAWLRFSLAPIGCRMRLKLLRQWGSPEALLGASVNSLQEWLDPQAAVSLAEAGARSDWAELTMHQEWLSIPENTMLSLADVDYPAALLDLPDAPVTLFVKGNVSWLDRPALSIVGSRQATPQGLENAQAFASDLSLSGYTIVSGLAAGIDAAAHRGGLAGLGSTVAVVGTGLDRVYPRSNRDLAHQIAMAGAVVSEFPLGSPPKAEHFPRRNRLIAALGKGCLVVEAALGSGSLITARQAADLGREVFAIPGSIHSPQSKGCHRLIKDGAKLVEAAQDIYEELSMLPLATMPASNIVSPQKRDEDILLTLMGWDPVDIDTLVLRSAKSVEEVMTALLMHELAGAVFALPGSRYQRKG